MIHSTMEVLKKARCLAKKAAALARRKDLESVECHHEIDALAQDAQYVLWETQELEEKEVK